jgi:hypothetical protein
MEINMREADESVFFRKVLEAGRKFHAMVERYVRKPAPLT